MSATIFIRNETVKRHPKKIVPSRKMDDNAGMHGRESVPTKHKEPFAEEGRRLRLFRKAEGFATAFAFAQAMDWPPSAVSQFESGKTRVTVNPALQLRKRFPGFDPLWLWEGDTRGLSFDLRKRIEAEEAKELGLGGKGNDILKYSGR